MARTIDEVAELSGVSRATVSRVMNGGSVSEKTRRRVRSRPGRDQLPAEPGCTDARVGPFGRIGVVMHIDPHLLFEDPYFCQLMQGISTVLADRTAGMMLWLGNRSKEETLGRILSMGILDGVVVTAQRLDDPLVDGLLASSLPTVLVGHRKRGPDRQLRGHRQRPRRGRDDDPPRLDRPQADRAHHGHAAATSPPWTASPATAGRMQRAGLATRTWSSTATSTPRPASPAPRRCWTAGPTRSSAPTTRRRRGARDDPRARPARAGGRRPRRLRRSGVRPPARSAAHDHPPGRPAAGRGGGESLLELIDDRDGSPRRVMLPTELVIRQSTVGGGPRS